MKNIFIILVSFVIFSCEKEEKSYEELEAEILCDILPEMAGILGGGGPIPEDKLNFEGNVISEEMLKAVSRQMDSVAKLIQDGQYDIGVCDTLLSVDTKNFVFFEPLKKKLDIRKIEAIELKDCKLKIDFYTINRLPPIKRTPEPKKGQIIYRINRVVISKNKKEAFVGLSRSFKHHKGALVRFNNDKWVIERMYPRKLFHIQNQSF